MITVELIWDIDDSMLTGITMDDANKIIDSGNMDATLSLFAKAAMAKDVKEIRPIKEVKEVEELTKASKEAFEILRGLRPPKIKVAEPVDANVAHIGEQPLGQSSTILPPLGSDIINLDYLKKWSLSAEESEKTKLKEPQATGQYKKIPLCFDFDGVIHSFVSGWTDFDIIPDEPVEGIKELLLDLYKSGRYIIMVFSSRCGYVGGVDAIREYMDRNGLMYDKVCMNKPNAVMYIDDLGYKFFSSDNLRAFLNDAYSIQLGMY